LDTPNDVKERHGHVAGRTRRLLTVRGVAGIRFKVAYYSRSLVMTMIRDEINTTIFLMCSAAVSDVKVAPRP
jgi:hypothetical protein